MSTENINLLGNEVNANVFPHRSKFAGSTHSNITIHAQSVAEVLFFLLNKYCTYLARKQINKQKRKQSIEHTPSVITSD